MSWFPLPETLSSKIFTRMPDRFRAPKRTLWADFNKGGAKVIRSWKGRLSIAVATSM